MAYFQPPALPSTAQVIKNTAYTDRVADLEGAKKDGPVIGYHSNGGTNQKWTLQAQGGKEYKISTTATENVTTSTVFANTSSPDADDTVYGSSSASTYTVKSTDGGNYKISIKSSDGKTDLYWTLASETEGTKVTLEKDTGSSNQIWSFSA